MLNILMIISIIFLVISLIGYFLVVMREKYYLKNNIIIIDNKSVSKEDFKDLDMTHMSYKGRKVKTGDEVKIITNEKKIYRGIFIGGKLKEGILKIVTLSDEVKELKIKSILNIKVVREYGKFFTK